MFSCNSHCPKIYLRPIVTRGGENFAGALYFAVAGETYGPAGPGPSVVNNVPLSPDALRANYNVADLESDADLARIVRVAEAEGTGQ